MNIQELIVQPTTLALITTFQCTAACKNCCFGCNPNIKARLSLKEIKNYIDQAVKFYEKSIRVLVFTGGEASLLQDDLLEAIRYGSSKGLITRVVSNGFWAKTYTEAYEYLSTLKEAGLQELNFSTGDEHQEWVSYENIVNGCMASMDLGLTTVVNVEIHDNSKFDANILVKDTRLLDYFDVFKYKNTLKVERGIWIPFRDNANISYNNIKSKNDLTTQRCLSLFTTLPINPYSQLMACCGLASEHIIPMRLGDLHKKNIKELYESQFYDLMKIWLFVDGPYKILSYIQKKRGIEKKLSGHICYVCASIFQDPDNIECIKRNYKEIMHTVMLKYMLLKSNLML